MRKHTAAGAAACLGVLVAAVAFPTTGIVLAAGCRAEPGGPTPAGYHWHYRLDHANNRKCWYLKNVSGVAEKEPSPRVRRSARHPDDEVTSSVRPRTAEEREALFEEFLRWRKRRDGGR